MENCLNLKVYILGGSVANITIDSIEVIDLDLQTTDTLKGKGKL
jgi:hypothetical protein